jgi:hypothetical protein
MRRCLFFGFFHKSPIYNIKALWHITIKECRLFQGICRYVFSKRRCMIQDTGCIIHNAWEILISKSEARNKFK